MIVTNPRRNVKACSPSVGHHERSDKKVAIRKGVKLTVLDQISPPIPQIVARLTLHHRSEEANKNQRNDYCNESQSVFGSSPKPLAGCLIPRLEGYFIIFLVPEVGKGDSNKAEQSIQEI
ncbi:hypothetical protein sulfate transporter [Aspergillus fumigatus]|nr:hypothetical protein sulfate transporter [Aspergillus fumigatus]